MARPPRGFVPVDEVRETREARDSAAGPASRAVPPAVRPTATNPADGWEGRVSLFGDLDR